jgi:hypothetical protein
MFSVPFSSPANKRLVDGLAGVLRCGDQARSIGSLRFVSNVQVQQQQQQQHRQQQQQFVLQRIRQRPALHPSRFDRAAHAGPPLLCNHNHHCPLMQFLR